MAARLSSQSPTIHDFAYAHEHLWVASMGGQRYIGAAARYSGNARWTTGFDGIGPFAHGMDPIGLTLLAMQLHCRTTSSDLQVAITLLPSVGYALVWPPVAGTESYDRACGLCEYPCRRPDCLS